MSTKQLLQDDILFAVVRYINVPGGPNVLAQVTRKDLLDGYLLPRAHFIVDKDGAVVGGRSIHLRGTMTDTHNESVLGIYMVGTPKVTTRKQRDALDTLITSFPRELEVLHEPQIPPGF